MSDAGDVQTADGNRRSSWGSVLVAPFVGLADVARSAAVLGRASALQLTALMLLIITTEAALCVWMCVWEDTVHYDFRHSTTQSSQNEVAPPIRTESMAAVWQRWVDLGDRNPAIGISTGAAFGTLACIVVAIALFWPRVYRHGRLNPALGRTYAAVLASTGYGLLLTAGIMTSAILIDHWSMRRGIPRYSGGLEAQHFAFPATLSSILFMLFVLGRAARGVSDKEFAPDPSPRCEGCGYNLTHRPESGRCPECGASVENSLTPGVRRRPASFDKSASLSAALSTSVRALFVPADFYSHLTMRANPQRDPALRVRHHAAIYAAAFVWIAIMIYSTNHGAWEWDETTGVLAGPLAVTIAGWAVQHAVGAVACLVWFIRRTLPDLRWGVRILNFETVYLWLFCGFNGVMVTTFIVFANWISKSLRVWRFPMPPEFFAIVLPNVALIAYWFVRLFRGGRAVRWANY